MTTVTELADEDLPEVLELIREQVSSVPPFVAPDDAEVVSILQDPRHQMRVWCPEETDDVFRAPCWVARSGGKVAAALQLHPEGPWPTQFRGIRQVSGNPSPTSPDSLDGGSVSTAKRAVLIKCGRAKP